MTRQFAFELFCLGGAIPALVAVVVTHLSLRLLPIRVAKRYAAACGFGCAFLAAYALLPSSLGASWRPARNWHWLPYLGGTAMILGPLGLARGIVILERWVLYLFLALSSAWFLVPTWEDLQPPRATFVPLLAGYFLLLPALLDPLPVRISARVYDSLLWLVAACSAASVWAAVSETFGRLGAVVAAACGGTCIANWLTQSRIASRSTAPLYAILVGGTAFVSFVYLPERTEWILLVIPATPLMLWCCTYGPLARLEGWKATGAQLACVLIPLALAAAIVIAGDSPMMP